MVFESVRFCDEITVMTGDGTAKIRAIIWLAARVPPPILENHRVGSPAIRNSIWRSLPRRASRDLRIERVHPPLIVIFFSKLLIGNRLHDLPSGCEFLMYPPIMRKKLGVQPMRDHRGGP